MVTPAPHRPMRRIQKMALIAVVVACLSAVSTASTAADMAITANGSTNSDAGTTTAPPPPTTAPPPTTTTPPPTTTTPPPTTTTPPPTTTKPTPTTPNPTPTTKTPSSDGSGNSEVTTPPPSTTAPPVTTTPEPTTTTTAAPTSTTKTPKPSTTRGSGSSSVDGLNNAGDDNLTTPTPSSSSHKSYGVIIGVAVVAAVVLIALGFVIYRHRSRKDDEDKELRRQLDQMDLELGSAAYAMAAGSGSGSGGNGSGSGGQRGSSDPRRSSLQFKNNAGRSPASWSSGRTTVRGSESDSLSPIWRNPELLAVKIPFEKIRFGEVLSRGGFGEVLTGVYHQQRVAIKRLLPEHRRRMASLEDFLKEALLLSTLDHPRVINFVGVAWDSPRDLCLVLEFMENGDLRNILTQWHEEGRKTGWNDPRKVRIALHIAEALTYLHTLTPKIVHRDLKSKNILVNGHWDAKISDFGVSREESTHNTMTTNVGSSLWIAPEVMVGNNYDEKADIFSFGVVLSELDSMQLPYHNVRTPDGRKLPDAAVLHMVTMGKVQAEFSSMSRTDMVLLGRACLAVDPAQRPTAGEVRYRLTQILSSY